MKKMRKPRVAIAYDFDGTLAPGSMQEHSFLPNVGISPKLFWNEVHELTRENEADEILMFMKLMIEKAEIAKQKVKKQDFIEAGKKIVLFSGVEDWFDSLDKFAKENGVVLEHYIISSGNQELIEGTKIAKKFKKIYASRFFYDHNELACWPALAVNYTNKTQFLFRINKGALDVCDKKSVNAFVEEQNRIIPFENIIFIGDGETDIPCFRLVKDKGGLSLAVYKPRASMDLASQLLREGRVDAIFPADYSKNSSIEQAVRARIVQISSTFNLKSKLGK